MSFDILPAIDVVAGKAVRLDRGRAGTEKSYGDPVEAARAFTEQGAQWLHVVDLDAAFDRGHNHDVLGRITEESGVRFQLAGGIRTDADLERALYGGDLWEVLERLDQAGCQRFLVTDVFKDGTLTGPNVELLRDIAMATDASITASGGVSTVEDVQDIARYQNDGIDSVVIGKALYEGKLSVHDALSAARETQPEPATDE